MSQINNRQVLPDPNDSAHPGEWVEAPPIEGAFIVNIGEMLTRWTNGRFKATPHRVVNTSGQKRYSGQFPHTLLQTIDGQWVHALLHYL